MIYAHEGNDLLINLFIPSTLTWNGMTVTQDNHFPQEPSTTVKLQMKKARQFAMKIRQPKWTENMSMTVNGSVVNYTTEGGYIVVNRQWKDGDVIRVNLPMHLSAETTPHTKEISSIEKDGIYDLFGRKLDSSNLPSKGIYIKNGKKYIVR